MWGSPERAIRLEDSDPLTTILLQITGPAHIPWQDQRWQELLHGYDVWVHVELQWENEIQQQDSSYATADSYSDDNPVEKPVLSRACRSLVANAPRSSNLAALVLHVTRMLQAITAPDETASATTATANAETVGNTQRFSNRIAMVGKARATAGALNLLRILIHAVLSASPPPNYAATIDHQHQDVLIEYWQDCFNYKSRREEEAPEHFVAPGLVQALLHFLVAQHDDNNTTKNIPEFYDTTTLVLELILVMLSTQLYRPMLSSFQRTPGTPIDALFWTAIMKQAKVSADSSSAWTPETLLSTLLEWQMARPPTLPNSIQHHNCQLVTQVVAATKGESKTPDGLYETHYIVKARANTNTDSEDRNKDGTVQSSTGTALTAGRYGKAKVLLDATKGVLVLSSSIIFLPIRLISLALGLFGSSQHQHHDPNSNTGYDQLHKQHLHSSLQKKTSRTRDVLWLTDSPIADLATTFLLLLINNERASGERNPFRQAIAGLVDNRWDQENNDNGDLPDLPQLEETMPLVSPVRRSMSGRNEQGALAVNFEGLFAAFGATAHTEVGALSLYTFLQAAPHFAEAVAVRSDLDTLVLPLLRTLYFSSSMRFFAADSYEAKTHGTTSRSKKLSIRNCPFRSQSQLYVMIILLLLFSQDVSFGADAFRRVAIQAVPWYKERNLKGISLGSMIILSIIRSLTFNLNRLQDPFLMSNCCAVLMNLSPAIVELHDYAAMRLAAVTVACMKRYMELTIEHPDDDEEDISTPNGMHGEVSRTLLQVIKHCLSSKNLDRNLHLIYALVYHQTDFKRVIASKDCPFRKSEYSRIQKVINGASAAIEKEGDGRTAAKALKVLLENVEALQKLVVEKRRRTADDDFTFTYEEEADPETFFVPYVWEVSICCVTASSIEWNKDKIQVFPLLDEDEVVDLPLDAVAAQQVDPTKFSKDVSDVV